MRRLVYFKDSWQPEGGCYALLWGMDGYGFANPEPHAGQSSSHPIPKVEGLRRIRLAVSFSMHRTWLKGF